MSHYDTLGVPEDASPEQIKQAFRRKARETHPDLNDGPDAEAEFKRVNEAYSVLSDEQQRRRYDARRQMGGTAWPEVDFWGSDGTTTEAQRGGWTYRVYTYPGQQTDHGNPWPPQPSLETDVTVPLRRTLTMLSAALGVWGLGALIPGLGFLISGFVALTLAAAFLLSVVWRVRDDLKAVQEPYGVFLRFGLWIVRSVAIISLWVVVPVILFNVGRQTDSVLLELLAPLTCVFGPALWLWFTDTVWGSRKEG